MGDVLAQLIFLALGLAVLYGLRWAWVQRRNYRKGLG